LVRKSLEVQLREKKGLKISANYIQNITYLVVHYLNYIDLYIIISWKKYFQNYHNKLRILFK